MTERTTATMSQIVRPTRVPPVRRHAPDPWRQQRLLTQTAARCATLERLLAAVLVLVAVTAFTSGYTYVFTYHVSTALQQVGDLLASVGAQ